MYRLTIIFFLLLGINADNYAQTTDIDEVHLVDQRVFRGKVVEQKPGDYIRLAIQGTSDTLTFTMDEIDKLLRVPTATTNEDQDVSDETDLKDEKGFNRNKISLFLQGSTGGGDVAFQGLGAGLNYRWTDRLSLGLVARYLGESSRSNPRPYQWQKIPVALRTTFELQPHFNGRSAIYSRLDLGYSFTINGDYENPADGAALSVSNGFMANPAIGYRVNFFKNIGMTIDVGYLLIADQIENASGNSIKSNNWSNFIATATLFF